jgi:hypothetical protein
LLFALRIYLLRSQETLTIIYFKNWRQLLSSQPEMQPKIEIPRFGVRLNSGFFGLGTQQLAPIFEMNNGQADDDEDDTVVVPEIVKKSLKRKREPAVFDEIIVEKEPRS